MFMYPSVVTTPCIKCMPPRMVSHCHTFCLHYWKYVLVNVLCRRDFPGASCSLGCAWRIMAYSPQQSTGRSWKHYATYEEYVYFKLECDVPFMLINF